MLYNARNPIILFFLSYLGVMLGIMFKIMHWAGGSIFIGSMIMVQAIAIIWLVFILLNRKKG